MDVDPANVSFDADVKACSAQPGSNLSCRRLLEAADKARAAGQHGAD
jgi:hypothetical protein